MSIEANAGVDYSDELESINLELWELSRELKPLQIERKNSNDKKIIEELYKAADEITGTKIKWGEKRSIENKDLQTAIIENVYRIFNIKNNLKLNNVQQNIIKGVIDEAVEVPGDLLQKFKDHPAESLFALYRLNKDPKNTLLQKVLFAFGESSLKTPEKQYQTWRRAVWIVVDLLEVI